LKKVNGSCRQSRIATNKPYVDFHEIGDFYIIHMTLSKK